MLADYFDQWARNVDLAYRTQGGSEDSHRVMLAAQRQRWIDPAVEAVKDDPILAHRVGKVALLHALAERLTESHRRRDEIRRLRESGEFDRAQHHLEKARTFTDELLAYFYQLADLNQGLMDRNEVPSFIKANVKGWLGEEARAIDNARREAGMEEVSPPE